MKYTKGLLVVALLSFLGITVQAQENIVKLYPVGFHFNAGEGGSNVDYLFKAGFERVFSDKLSAQINLGIQFDRYSYGWGTYTFNRFVIEPQVKYYLLDAAPHGLYIGGYMIAAIRSNATILGLGPNVGYQHFFLDDRLAVDANIGLGVGIFTGGGSTSAGFDMPFQVGAGWAF